MIKGINFTETWREAGNPVSMARVYDSYGVDEMIFLDVDATPSNTIVDGSIIERVSEEVFMPFTVGGGSPNFPRSKNCWPRVQIKCA